MFKLLSATVLVMLFTIMTGGLLHSQDTEVELAVGVLTSNNILDYNDSIFNEVFPEEDVTSTDTHSAGFAISYRTRVRRNLKAGGQLSYQRKDKEFIRDNVKIGEGTVDFFSLVATSNYYWLENDRWGIFTGLGAGFSYSTEDQFGFSDEERSRTETDLFLAWQVHPVGIEFGRDFRFITNAGFGNQGVVSLGLKYRF